MEGFRSLHCRDGSSVVIGDYWPVVGADYKYPDLGVCSSYMPTIIWLNPNSIAE